MHDAVLAQVLADDLRDVSWQVYAVLMPATLGNSLSTPAAQAAMMDSMSFAAHGTPE